MSNEKNNNIHDLAFKETMIIKKNCFDVLKYLASIEILKDIKNKDIDIEYINTGFIDQFYNEKRADILVSINKKNDRQLVYILFEHKSTVDKDVSLQLLQYITCIVENQKKNEGKISPIIPVVFYHGERKWNVSKYLLGREYKNKHIFNFSYQLINIQDISEEEYESNLKWIIFAFKNIWRIQRDDKDLYSIIKYFLSILKYEKDDKFALQTIKALLLYLVNAFPATKRVEATKIITEYY